MICHCRRAVLDFQPSCQKPNQQLTILIAVCCECLIETSNPEEQFPPNGHIAEVSQPDPVVGSGKLLVPSMPNPGEVMGGRRRRGIENDEDGAENNTLVCSLVGIQMGVKQSGNRFHIIVQQHEQVAAGDSNASIARGRSALARVPDRL